jgi:hypothetical protein
MCPHVFLRPMQSVENVDPYFNFRYDAVGRARLSGLQKCVAAICILVYGLPTDAVDEYVRIGESTPVNLLIISVQPSSLYLGNSTFGLGMRGSIDCMHWAWRSCPTTWKGQFTGRGKQPTMILEAVAAHDLWIWHAYFDMPGSCNDINVLQRSPVFSPYLKNQCPDARFTVNRNSYDVGYFLADDIYPEWPAFVKTMRNPIDHMKLYFARV